jgi:hypothetical protein
MASSDYERVRIRFPSSLKECLFYSTDCNADRSFHTDYLLEIGDAPFASCLSAEWISSRKSS